MAGPNIIHFEPHDKEPGFLELPWYQVLNEYECMIFGIVPKGIMVGAGLDMRLTENHYSTVLVPWREIAWLRISHSYSMWRILGGVLSLCGCAFAAYEILNRSSSVDPRTFTILFLSPLLAAFLLLGFRCTRMEARTKPDERGRVTIFTWLSPPLERDVTRAHCAVALRYAKAAGVPVTSHIDDDGAEFPEPPPPSSN